MQINIEQKMFITFLKNLLSKKTNEEICSDLKADIFKSTHNYLVLKFKLVFSFTISLEYNFEIN